jgi:hypothetical protein
MKPGGDAGDAVELVAWPQPTGDSRFVRYQPPIQLSGAQGL